MERACLTLLAAAGLVFGAASASAVPRDVSGTWLTQDGRARIRMEKCGAARDQLCGYVVWVKPGSNKYPNDRYNPDPSKTERPILGHQLLLGLRPDADDRYAGQIYNADDGKRYDVTIWLESQEELKLRGCLVAFLCSTQSWSRATDVAAGQLVAATGAPGGPQPDPEYARPAASNPVKRDPKPKS